MPLPSSTTKISSLSEWQWTDAPASPGGTTQFRPVRTDPAAPPARAIGPRLSFDVVEVDDVRRTGAGLGQLELAGVGLEVPG